MSSLPERHGRYGHPAVDDRDTTVNSNVTAYINDSNVQAGGGVSVLSGFQDPSDLPDAVSRAETTLLFDPSVDVTVSSGIIEFDVPHGFSTGQRVLYDNQGNTSVGGIQNDIVYHVIKVDDTRLRLARTEGQALSGEGVELTDTGSGLQHQLHPRMN